MRYHTVDPPAATSSCSEARLLLCCILPRSVARRPTVKLIIIIYVIYRYCVVNVREYMETTVRFVALMRMEWLVTICRAVIVDAGWDDAVL